MGGQFSASALECFIRSAQGSEACDAAIDSILKPILAVNACASSALIELEQSSWMQRTFGSLSRAFAQRLHETISRCIDLILHLITCTQSHIATPNSFCETNTALPFIILQCSSALSLLRHALSCTSSSSSSSPSLSFTITPHPIDVRPLVALCNSGLEVLSKL